MAAITLSPAAASRGSSPQHRPVSPKRSHSPSQSLQCALCQQSYNDARILSCLHSFCAECLEKFCLQCSDTTPSVYCPKCMEETRLSPKGVDGLPKNLYVKHLLDLQDGAGNDARKCDLCLDSELASSYCRACGYNLCTLCSQAHKKQRKTSQHSLVPTEGMPPGLILDSILNGAHKVRETQVPLCAVHRSYQLSLFCETCSTPVCQMCSLAQHCEHRFVSLDGATKQQEEILRSLITRTKPFLVSLSDSLSTLDFMMRNVEERAQTVATEICDSTDEKMRALQEHKRLLLSRLESIKTHKLDTLSQQQDEVQSTFDSVSTLSNIASTALRERNPMSVFSTDRPITAELESIMNCRQDLSPREDDYVHYSPNSSADPIRGIKIFGTLDAQGPSAAHSLGEGEGLFEARQGQTATFTVTVNDRFKERRTSGEDVVECRVESRDGSPLAASATNLGKGVYKFSYTPENSGEHSVSVLIQGKHIRSSPFLVTVLPQGSRHTGVFHCCSWCSSKGKKHVRCGCGSRMSGGYSGCGHGHPGHPGCNHWSCCGNRVEKSQCSV